VATRIRGDADAVARAAEMLAKAERPVIIAGDAVAQSGAHKELIALAEAIAAPVYVEFIPSRASFPASHPLYRGMMTRTQAGVREVLDKHDLVFSVGGDLFTWSLPSHVDPWPKGLPLIHLDTDPWQIGKNYPAQVAILGDPKATLPDITAELGARLSASAKSAASARLKSTADAIKKDLDAFRAKARAMAGKTPVQPLALLEAIGAMLPKNAVVIEEALSSAPGIRMLINSNDEQSFYGLRGGGIGWGLPAAIGAKVALPDRPVVALIGDGSAMYTIQALWTAAHYRLPVIWVIFNNTSYRILKQRLVMLRGLAEQADKFVGMELTDPAVDFIGLARSLGIEGHRAKTVHEATDLIGKALKDGTAMLIDVDMERGYKPM
jgi:benzoylformate decarboxylase